MRLRLFLSFVFIILITVTSVVLILRQNAVDEVRQYVFRGGMMEGRMGGNAPTTPYRSRLQILDEDGYIMGDTQPESGQMGDRVPSLEGAIPLRVQGQVVGYLLPDTPFIFSQQDESVLIARLNRAALTAGAISGVVALLLAMYLGYRLLKPIRALSHAAEKIKSGDLGHRVDIQGSGEPASLGQVFNQMARAIEHIDERRKALTADIAHELRTPYLCSKSTSKP